MSPSVQFKNVVRTGVGLTGLLLCVLSFSKTCNGSDYLFISEPYLQLTKQVMREADLQAKDIFGAGTEAENKYQSFSAALMEQINDTERKRLQKKITSDFITDQKDKIFADALNSFKDALNAMAAQSGKSLSTLLPSYTRWNNTEAAVVKSGIESRLKSFQTRFGPDSEPINVLELFVGEKYLAGDESGPSPWEPILRFSAVQVTSRSSSLTSGFEIGSNYYFLHGNPPKPLSWIGVSNHVGLAATLQYLEDPGAFNFRGQPEFGLMIHLDRKETGVTWDNVNRKFRITVGYAFQFIPFVF